VTRWLEEESRRVAGEDFEIVAVSASSGLDAIETPQQVAQAANAVVWTIKADGAAAAAIIAAFGDPGLTEARARSLTPVIGLGEAGMRAAGRDGRRFSIVTLGGAMRAPIAARAQTLGLEGQLIAILVLSCSIPEMIRDRDMRRAEIVGGIRACEGEAVLLAGAPFASLGARFARETSRDVIDGVAACINAARKELGKL